MHCVTRREDCIYYIAVAVSQPSAFHETATFTLTARTPGDLTLIPCDSQDYPDGIKTAAMDSISSEAPQHFYEICGASARVGLSVELEQCAGSTALYVCADDNSCADILPSTTSWGYFSSALQSCVHSFNPLVPARKRDTCVVKPYGKAGNPVVQLPQREGNYFVMARGAGSFLFKVQATSAAPILVPAVDSNVLSSTVDPFPHVHLLT